MNKIIDYLRINEWLDSKVTMMLGVAAYFLYIDKVRVKDTLLLLLAYFLFLSMYLALSYVFNDYTDIDIDKNAGKVKLISSIPKKVIITSFFAMALIGDIPIILVVENKILCLFMILLITFFGLAYSLPGIRFKEKGLLGLIECSFAQRCLPLTLILLFIDLTRSNLFYWGVWFALSFFDGLRYILIHQYIDQENDRTTNTHTFVLDKQVSIREYIKWLCIFEMVCGLILLFPLIAENYLIIIFGIVLCVLLEFCIYKVLNVFVNKDWLVSFDSVPLEAYFNIIMPIMIGICMIKTNDLAGLFIILILICSIQSIKAKWNIVAEYLYAKLF